MKAKNLSKIFFIFFAASFCFLFLGSLVFAQEVEEIYPDVPGAVSPSDTRPLLPEYTQYLFNFSVIIAGIIAFVSLAYGGLRYLASAGNPITMSDARSQIGAGILGLTIVITAYLVLSQINPELTILSIGKDEFEKGAILYDVNDCPGGNNPTGKEGEDFKRVRNPLSSLGGFGNKANSIYIYDSSDELDVKIYSNQDYGPDPQNPMWKTADHAPYPPPDPICFNIPPNNAESISLQWKLPGVYLFTDNNCKEEPRLFTTSVSDFKGIGLGDKAGSIKIIPEIRRQVECNLTMGAPCGFIAPLTGCIRPGSDGKPIIDACRITTETIVSKLGAVLHEHSNYEGDAEAFFGGDIIFDSVNDQLRWCQPLGSAGSPCSNNVNDSYCRESVGENKASAITIFQQWQSSSVNPTLTGGVTLYSNYDLNDEGGADPNRSCRFDLSFLPKPLWVNPGDCSGVLGAGITSSIRITGDYIAVLFRDDGRGNVFRDTDLRLKDDHIGDNQARYMLVIPAIKRGF